MCGTLAQFPILASTLQPFIVSTILDVTLQRGELLPVFLRLDCDYDYDYEPEHEFVIRRHAVA